MAESYVSKDQFEEFTKRMEQGFDHVSQQFDRVSQQFDRVSQQFEHVNQQFDQVNRRIDLMTTDIRADMRQMRNGLIGLYGIVVFGFIGSIFVTIIKQSIK